MRLEIKDKAHVVEIEVEPITQICGVNFKIKNLIIQSLVRHFSGYKYREYELDLMNNVLWNGEVIGRKYFSIIHIKNREDLLKALSVAKTSIVLDYLINIFSDADCREIEEHLVWILEKMSRMMNSTLKKDGIDLEWEFEEKTIMEIVQGGVLKGESDKLLEELETEELLERFLYILDVVQRKKPEKKLIIIENIDHMTDMEFYEKFCVLAGNIGKMRGINFIVTTSIQGYVMVKKEFMPGIMVVNDEVFSFPEWEHMYDFVERNYPCQMKRTDEECMEDLKAIVQEIGRKNAVINIRSEVVLKMINQTLGINPVKVHCMNEMEKNYIVKTI